jgi:hypothetical protein
MFSRLRRNFGFFVELWLATLAGETGNAAGSPETWPNRVLVRRFLANRTK